MNGIIALDIDGTLTHDISSISPRVLDYLHGLQGTGWTLMLLTGRTFSFAHRIFSRFRVPFYLAVQNGAEVCAMPKENRVYSHFMTRNDVRTIDTLLSPFPESYLLYTGSTCGDFCYFRPQAFGPEMLSYLKKLEMISTSPWKAFSSFDGVEGEGFPLIKYFGTRPVLFDVQSCIDPLRFASTCINDSIEKERSMLLVGHPLATKGHALRELVRRFSLKGPVIAAGDEMNDLSLLEAAQYKIAMEDGADELKAIADIIAPPAHKEK